MGRIIGIDLGTTKSCVAVMEDGAPRVIPNQEGERSTPSVVCFTTSGETLVGAAARRRALADPRNTAYAVKRLIGRKFDAPETQEARRVLPYELVAADNGDAHIRIADRVYSPPEICGLILQKLKAAAEDHLGEELEEAIITVPAYFNDPQRQAVRDAGRIAGLSVARLINEPTAAALAYGLGASGGDGQFVAVYDLGGGTFDITILEMADGLFQVRATGGDTYLGGEDFDHRIVLWLIEEFRKQTGIVLEQDPMALPRLKEAAERAKCELSVTLRAQIGLPLIATDASGPRHLLAELTRERYDALTDDLLRRAVTLCEHCLADAGLEAGQLDEVVLVGSQTRMPRVSELVKAAFHRRPNRSVDPEEAVALGAAVQSGIMLGEVKDLVLLDVTPHTLGIETKDGTFTSLIDRNSTIPTRRSRVFTTVADDQTRVEVHVLEGESDIAAYNNSLAKLEVRDIPPAPRGGPQIEVSFEIDVNGIVSVSAQDQATGRSQSMVIHPSSGLGEDEVGRLVEEARARETARRDRRDAARLVGQTESLVGNLLRAVQTLEGRLTAPEQAGIFEAIGRARTALVRAKTGNPSLEELRMSLADLEKAATVIGQAMLRP